MRGFGAELSVDVGVTVCLSSFFSPQEHAVFLD